MSDWRRSDDSVEVEGVRVFEGTLDATDMTIGIVVARFNDRITGEMLLGAVEELELRGVGSEQIDIAWVPGAFELPLVARKMAETGRYRAIVCLGAVIRGETAHFDFVAGEAAAGIALAGLETGIPVLFGVLTTDNIAQAEQRADRTRDNKGAETAAAAIEMANLLVALED